MTFAAAPVAPTNTRRTASTAPGGPPDGSPIHKPMNDDALQRLADHLARQLP
jgi:hypothetical protein